MSISHFLYGFFIFLVVIAAATGVTYMFVMIGSLLKPLFPERRDGPVDSVMKMAEAIDQSLKGYRKWDRQAVGDSVYWKCAANLFLISIALEPAGRQMRLSVNLNHELRFDFSMERQGGARGGFRMTGINEPLEKRLLKAPELNPILARLDFFDWIDVSESSITAEKQLDDAVPLETWSRAFAGLITCLRFLIRFQEAPSAQPGGAQICPYCRGAITQDEAGTVCPRCGTLHHAECWQQSGRCSVFGCAKTSTAPR